jgi:DNA repair protein RadD
MLTLRPYQEAAKAAVYDHLRLRDDNPCVVIPTGGGKTPVMASICKDAVSLWSGRVLILAHVKELLEQSADKLRAVCPELKFGIYSAGLKRRDTREPVIVAGIQSVFRRAGELDAFDLIVVDEAHMIPPEGDGMYQQFLAEARIVNPEVRIIGMTATPYRMKDGMICTPDHFLNHVCYEVGVRELIRDGFLSPLITKAGRQQVDTSKLHVRGGEFVAGEVEDLMDDDTLVDAACQEIMDYCTDRQSVLIFTSGIQHGQHVARVLRDTHGVECGFVCGDTPTAERDDLLGRFKSGDFKFLCNVNVLTTGFDAPNIDCVAMLRPTMSPGLYYQMVGRGFRLHPGKQNCLVLDFGGNVLRHGPVDAIDVSPAESYGDGNAAPAKKCPACHSVIAAGFSICPDCEFEFPAPQRKQHAAKASDAGILSGQVTDTEHEVRDIAWSVHQKRDAPDDAPKSMRVDYRLGLSHWQSEWICIEHDGYARDKAVAWWQRRTHDPVPDSAERAVELAEAGALCHTEKIVVRSVAGERYDRIVGYKLGALPEEVPAWSDTFNEEEVPF